MKNSWSTRKKTLIFAISSVMVFTLADMALTYIYASLGVSIYFDPVLVEQFFGFMSLISGLGGGLTAAEILAETVTKIVESKNETKKVKKKKEVIKG